MRWLRSVLGKSRDPWAVWQCGRCGKVHCTDWHAWSDHTLRLHKWLFCPGYQLQPLFGPDRSA